MEHTCASHNDPQYYLMSLPSDWNDPSLFNGIHPFQRPAQFLPSPWSSSWLLFWSFPQCQLSHSAQHTIHFNVGWHISSDWSLSFSLVFSATQLVMSESPQRVLCLWTSKLSILSQGAGRKPSCAFSLAHRACWKPLKSTRAYPVSCYGF